MDNDPTKKHNSNPAKEPQTVSANSSNMVQTATSSTPAAGTISEQETLASASPAVAQPTVAQNDSVMPGTDQNQPVVVVMKPPKKNKFGVIVAILVLVLILISGIGLAVWYFVVYNNPENIAFDAVRQFITADNIVITGELNNRFVSTYDYDFGCTTENDPGIQMDCLPEAKTNLFKLKFESASNHLPNMTKVSLEISERDENDKIVDNHEVSLDLGTGVMADGVIYLQVSKLHETFEQAKQIYISSANSDINDVQEQVALAEQVVDLIDNEWWQISIEDIADTASDILAVGQSETQPVVDAYKCIFKVASANHSKDLADIYDQSRFLSIEKTDRNTGVAGRSFYKASFDYDKLADFYNSAMRSAAAQEITVCLNDYFEDMDSSRRVSIDDIPKLTTKDFEEELPAEWNIYLDIADFSHKLHGIAFDAKDPGQEIDAQWNFDYVDAEVVAPEDYRPITELVEEIMQIFYQFEPDEEVEDDMDLSKIYMN